VGLALVIAAGRSGTLAAAGAASFENEMIQPLRKMHRLIFFALAVLLPLLFIAALAVRKPMPVNQPFPSQLLKTK
jgi:hypothetical protein